MEHRSLLRLFGLCSFIGGSLIALFQIWFYIDPISFVATYFDHVGWAFITFGFIGLYLVQYRETRGLGFFSFLALSFGMFQWLGYKWFLAFVAPDLRKSAPELLDSGLQSVIYGVEFSNYFLQASFFLFAVISLFKGIHSKWGLSLLLIGSALAFNSQLEPVVIYSPLLPQAMIGLAIAWIGLPLFRGDQEYTYEELEDISEIGMEPITSVGNEKNNVLDVKLVDEENSLQVDTFQDVVLEPIQSEEKKQEVSTS
jgi:hypothetical protein